MSAIVSLRCRNRTGRLLMWPALVLLACPEATLLARDRPTRGSVRHSSEKRPDGAYSRQTPRGGQATTSQSTYSSGQRRSTTLDSPSGRSATGSRDVSRSDDTVTVDRNLETASGASRESTREVEFDDGRVESVEGQRTTTGRYGESVTREREAEREGRGWDVEGDARTSTGREADVDGYAVRGPGGSGRVVADVDTRYHGSRTVAGARGAYGRGVVRTLPYGARPYAYGGRRYYAHAGMYYRPYYWGGAWHYARLWPPYGVVVYDVPPGAVVLTIAGLTYLLSDNGAYYQQTNTGGSVSYVVVQAPAGAAVAALPVGHVRVRAGGTTYFYLSGTFYRQTVVGGQTSYVVATQPQGVVVAGALPAGYTMVEAAGATYFVATGTYYVPYLLPSGEEQYLIVDAPATATPAGQAAATDYTVEHQPITLPAGSAVTVRTASELSTERHAAGYRFQGYLNSDLWANMLLIASRGNRVWGQVVAVQKGQKGGGPPPRIVVQLTDLEVGGRAVRLVSSPLEVSGDAGKGGSRVMGGAAVGAAVGGAADGWEGAGKGALIGAAAGMLATASSPAPQAVIPAQTPLRFSLAQPLTVQRAVKVANPAGQGPVT